MAEDVVTEIEIDEARPVKRKAGGVSPRQLDKAASELNLIRVNAAGLLNIATVGRFLDRIGILHYGNGRLLGSAAMLADGAEKCARLADRDGLSDDIRQGYLSLQLKFIEALDANVEAHTDLNNAPVNEGARDNRPTPLPSKPFLAGAQIAPIQINVHAGTATITEGSQPKEKT